MGGRGEGQEDARRHRHDRGRGRDRQDDHVQDRHGRAEERSGHGRGAPQDEGHQGRRYRHAHLHRQGDGRARGHLRHQDHGRREEEVTDRRLEAGLPETPGVPFFCARTPHRCRYTHPAWGGPVMRSRASTERGSRGGAAIPAWIAAGALLAGGGAVRAAEPPVVVAAATESGAPAAPAPPPKAADDERSVSGLEVNASKPYFAKRGPTFGGYGSFLYQNFTTSRDDDTPANQPS